MNRKDMHGSFRSSTDQPRYSPPKLRIFVILAATVFIMTIFLWPAPWLRAGGDNISWSEIQSSIARRFPDVGSLETNELAAWLAEPDRPRPLIVDVRTREEFEMSHLPGAVHAERVEAILPLLGGVAEEQPVVLYCSVGWRSAVVAEALRQIGRKNVWNLRGSIFQWANEGRPLMRNGKLNRVVHPYDLRWGVLLSRELWPKNFAR